MPKQPDEKRKPTPAIEQTSSTSATETRTFRLVVDSAAEAVTLIQQKLGKRATVQSVKQHQPKGVSKLWTSNKLEIIVSVPPENAAPQPFELPDEKPETADAKAQGTTSFRQPAAKQISAEDALPEIDPPENANTPAAPAPSAKQISAYTQPTSPSRKPSLELPRIEALLRQSGFPGSLIDRFGQLPQWDNLNQRPLEHALAEVISLLRDEYLKVQNRPLSDGVAFIGTPGVGKSTVLRKHVANQVFVHGRKVQILKLDDEEPNPDDMLTVFCDIIGIPLVRDPSDLNLATDTQLFVDLPGLHNNEGERLFSFRKTLNELNIDSRVLVMNAMYDEYSLGSAFELGRKMGTTHQTFTHLDELPKWEKLWKFVLTGSHPLVFMSMGDESAPYPNEDFLPLLINKTFPRALVQP